MDIRRIPILSLSSTISMTDLMSELPLPTPHPDSLSQSLWYSQDVFNEAYKILNSNNSFIFESIAIALSSTSTDEIILKDTVESSTQINMNAVPSVFCQMVQRDIEKFKNKIGFQDFYVKESKTIKKLPSDSVTTKDKNEKLPRKKKKKRKEPQVVNDLENTVKNRSEAYSISHKSNGLCFSFKKIKSPSNETPILTNTSDQTSLPIKPLDTQLLENPNPVIEPNTLSTAISSTPPVPLKIEISESFNSTVKPVTVEKQSSKDTDKHITEEAKLKDSNTTIINNIKEEKDLYQSTVKHCTIKENYFSSITGLDHTGDVFNSNSIFESDVSTSLQVIDPQNSTDDFLDGSGFKSSPHSNSLSTHELQLNDSSVKTSILGIDYTRSDLGTNSPLHDDSQSYQQHNQQFGLAAYLTKTTNSHSISNNNQANNNNISSSNVIGNSNNNTNNNNSSNADHQPGSCLSAGHNSYDNYDLKNSDASIPESANPNGPNSAFSEIDLQDRKMEKRSRGRNKELENLKRWQIKDKGMPHTDDILDSATVGPGERVKKRTRRCVKRNEIEDCSSMSEHSYHTADVSPVAREIAQINHSESSLDDEIRLSPAVTHSSPFESNSETLNNLPLLKENAQTKSAIDSICIDLNFNSTDIASSLASITPDEDLPEVLSQTKSKIKGKKLPSNLEPSVLGKAQLNQCYTAGNNHGPLPVEIMGNISDESSDESSSDFSAKCKSKTHLKTNKKTKKAKNSYYKPSSNNDSRFQHLFINKEEKVLCRERVFRATQYNKNMNPVVVLSPMPDDLGYHDLNSPSSSNTVSTLPFTYDPDLEMMNSDSDLQHNSSLSKYYDNVKLQFSKFLDSLLKDVEELDLSDIASNYKNPNFFGSFQHIEHDAKLSSKNLYLLNSYIAKMKSYKIMNQVLGGKLVRLLTLLLVNMTSFINVPNDSKKKVQKLLQEQLLSCLDASLIALTIMISPDMPRAVFLEEVIEQACDLFRTVMRHIIYPVYDITAKCQPNPNDVLMNIISNLIVNKSQSNFLSKIYSRVQCGINCLSELMHQQPSRLTDAAVLKLTSLAISSLSVNINDIQSSIIPIMAAAFSQYEGHRKSIIGELLSIMTHSQGKKIVRTYKINSEEEIQTMSAVIVILFQSVVQKPKSNKKSHSSKQTSIDSCVEQSVISTLNSSHRIIQIFIHTFFKKVCFKGEDNYKIAFERFLQDLFLIYNKPEWPAVNSLLNCIGNTLVYHLNTSQTNRTIAIDLLGTMCSFMYRHINMDNFKSKPINRILKDLFANISKTCPLKLQSDVVIPEDEQVRLLKYLLLNFLSLDSSDSTCMYSKRYCAGLWLHELYSANENGTHSSKKIDSMEQGHIFSKVEEEYKKILLTQLLPNSCSIYTNEITELSYENCFKICRFLSLSKDMQYFELYLSRICKSLDENSIPARTKAMRSLTLVLEEDPSLLLKSEIEKSVNRRFLDSAITVREATVDLIGKFLLQKPELISQYYPVLINRIVDTGTSVRKRVIKVLWDICSSQNDFTNSAAVYAKIMKRMYDEESIKKLVNEVFKSSWFSPISDKDPVRLQQRIFSIADVIHSLGHDQKCNHNWVLQFITQLCKIEKENTDTKYQKSFEKSYQQIVEFLVQTVLRLQEVSCNATDSNITTTHNSKSVLSSHQKLLCSTWSALHIFAKVKPKLIWPYLSELSVLLRQIRSSENGPNLKQTLMQNNDMAICMNHLCGTLDAGLSAVQSYENLEYSNIHLSKENLNDIANDLINLATNAPKRFIVDSVIKCLSKVTSFTQEFSCARNLFLKYFTSAMRFTDQLKQNPKLWKADDSKSAALCRILYTSVVLCRFFDMKQLLNESMMSQEDSVFSRLLDITIYCAENLPKNSELRNKSVFNMNHLVHKDRHLLINGPIHKFYIKTLNLILEEQVLSNDTARMITSILDNISNFLKHNELKMVEENSNWKSRCHNESLKESNDVSGSFGNVVAQIYFKLVLECCLVGRTEIRFAGLNLVCKILSQGLVQPMMSVGYLIALQGDIDNSIRFKADSQLTELHNKYPGFLNMRAIPGIRLSFKLQKSISKISQIENDKALPANKSLIRGWTYLNGNPFQANSAEPNSVSNILAINHQLFSSLRKIKQHWRSFLDGMVNMFDESQQCDIFEQIFIADQLATFPYQIQEEPIFVVHKLDLLISVVGPTILRCCKDVFKQLSKPIADRAYKDGELTPNEMTILVKLLSESSFENKQLVYLSIRSSQVSLLMIALKDYIKNVYGIIDSKISNYSPENNTKQWDKQVSRNANSFPFEIPSHCLASLPDLDNLKSDDVNSNFVKQLIIDFIDFRNKIMAIDTKGKTATTTITNTNNYNKDFQDVSLSNDTNFEINKPKVDTMNKAKTFESRVDSKPPMIPDNKEKMKTKIVRAETQSDSEVSNSTSSESVKVVTPKKQKISYSGGSSSNRVPIAGKEIPNLDLKSPVLGTDKSNKTPLDIRKSLSSGSLNENQLNGKSSSKPKSTDKNQAKVSLTTLPSDFIGSSLNSSKAKPCNSKSFRPSAGNTDNSRTPIISSKSFPISINKSGDHQRNMSDRRYSSTSASINPAPSKTVPKPVHDNNNCKRPSSFSNVKKTKKRKRMVITSSSDSDDNSD